MLYLWERPWARLHGAKCRYRALTDSAAPVSLGRGAHWLYSEPPVPVRVGDRAEPAKAESWLGPGVVGLPLPLRPTHTLRVLAGGTALLLDASALPARPEEDRDFEHETEQGAKALLDRG